MNSKQIREEKAKQATEEFTRMEAEMANTGDNPEPAPVEAVSAEADTADAPKPIINAEPADKPEVTPIVADKPEVTPIVPESAELTTPAIDFNFADKKEDYEHKYNTLTGIFSKVAKDGEVLKKEQQAKFEQLNKEMEALKAENERLNVSMQAEYNELKSELGDETANKLLTVLNKKTAGVKTEIEQAVSQMGAEIAKTKRDIYLSSLQSVVPDYQLLNTNPEFDVWLKQKDPYYGRTLKELLWEANQSMDVSRVANFFNEFKRGKQLKSAEAQAKMETLASPAKGSGTVPKENMDDVPKMTTTQVSNYLNRRRKRKTTAEEDKKYALWEANFEKEYLQSVG